MSRMWMSRIALSVGLNMPPIILFSVVVASWWIWHTGPLELVVPTGNFQFLRILFSVIYLTLYHFSLIVGYVSGHLASLEKLQAENQLQKELLVSNRHSFRPQSTSTGRIIHELLVGPILRRSYLGNAVKLSRVCDLAFVVLSPISVIANIILLVRPSHSLAQMKFEDINAMVTWKNRYQIAAATYIFLQVFSAIHFLIDAQKIAFEIGFDHRIDFMRRDTEEARSKSVFVFDNELYQGIDSMVEHHQQQPEKGSILEIKDVEMEP